MAVMAPHPKHIEDMNCDCEDEEVDILTGRSICPSCGRTRWLTTEQLQDHQRLQAEYDEAMERDNT